MIVQSDRINSIALHTLWGDVKNRYRYYFLYYKNAPDIKIFYEAPPALSYLVNKSCAAYDLRRSNRITVPRFNSYFLKNSISHRGAILWNVVCTYYTGSQFTTFHRNVKKDSYIKDLDFNAQSVQSIPRYFQDFKCF